MSATGIIWDAAQGARSGVRENLFLMIHNQNIAALSALSNTSLHHTHSSQLIECQMKGAIA
jgi:hypothetical protein